MILGDNPLLAHLKKRNLIQSDADLLRAFLHLGTLDEVADKMGQYNALIERFGDPWGKLLAYETIDHEFGPFREWSPLLRSALHGRDEQTPQSSGSDHPPVAVAVMEAEIDLRHSDTFLMKNQVDASLNGVYRLVRVAVDDSSVLQLDENQFLV